MRRIWKILTNNIGLKLISVILAFILWLVVVNINNPKTTVTFTAMATIENASVITDNGKVYDILDDSNLVTFTVSGPRTTVENLSASDFEVVADMNKIDLDLGLVPIDVTPLKHASQITVEKKTTNLKVAIEDLATEQFVITANANGTAKEGYAKGELTVDPTMVTVSGPESVVSSIGKAVATINIDGAGGERSQTVAPIFYDESGNVINSEILEVSPQTVQVKAQILVTKEVPIKIGSTGDPKEGYALAEIKCSPETAVIKGTKEVLSGIDEIQIPAKEIDIRGASQDVELKLDLSQYLPSGTELYDSDLAHVVVTAVIKRKINRTLTIDVSDIIAEQMPDGYEAAYDKDQYKVILTGLSDQVTALTADDIEPTLDFSEVTEGEFRIELNVLLPDGVSQYEKVYISGKLQVKDTQDDSDNDSQKPGGQ